MEYKTERAITSYWNYFINNTCNKNDYETYTKAKYWCMGMEEGMIISDNKDSKIFEFLYEFCAERSLISE